MATTHDHTHDTLPSDKGMGKTLITQGVILGVIVVCLVIASITGLI